MAVTLLFSSLFGALFGLYLDDISVIMQGAQTPARIAYVAMSKLVYIAVYYLILRFSGSRDSIDLKNSMYVFAFTVITSIGLGLLMNLTPAVGDERLKYSVFVLILVLIVSNTMVYFMIYEIQKLLKNRYELKLMREKMAYEQSRTEEANAIWDNIRKVRHDMKNHLAVISGKLDGGDTEGCKSYLQSLSATVESMGDLIRSNNSVLDYLINSKLSGLRDTQVLISGYVGNLSDIEDSDLACMIGNILDNAVEAQNDVQNGRRIELYFRAEKKNRIIICQNTVPASVLKNNKELKSTKSGDRGYGHRIVETVVKKYNGWIEYFETDEDMFGVQIILPEK